MSEHDITSWHLNADSTVMFDDFGFFRGEDTEHAVAPRMKMIDFGWAKKKEPNL